MAVRTTEGVPGRIETGGSAIKKSMKEKRKERT
jgi:hypothetical protein